MQNVKFMVLVLIGLAASRCLGQAPAGYRQYDDRIDIALPAGTLSICPLADNAVRIRFFQGNDARKRLTIGARKGSFAGMLQTRTFNVVLVREKKGVGVDVSGAPDRAITYTGGEVVTDFR